METLQLMWGENALAYFLCNERARWQGPISTSQRIRVILVCYTWLAVLVFVSIQVYLGLRRVFGIRVKTSYHLALVSFYGEISALILVFALPAFQGAVMINTDVLSTIRDPPEGGILQEGAHILHWLFLANATS